MQGELGRGVRIFKDKRTLDMNLHNFAAYVSSYKKYFQRDDEKLTTYLSKCICMVCWMYSKIIDGCISSLFFLFKILLA